MPREMISSPLGPFHVKVGWANDQDVQVGVETDGERSLKTFMQDPDADKIGEAVWQAFMNLDVDSDNDAGPVNTAFFENLGQTVFNILDSEGGDYRGVWATLDREGCNRLIRILRRARNSAFGEDA